MCQDVESDRSIDLSAVRCINYGPTFRRNGTIIIIYAFYYNKSKSHTNDISEHRGYSV